MHALAGELLHRRLADPAEAVAVLAELAPQRHGGAVVLGVPGAVVIGHGGSDAAAVASCVRLAAHAVREQLVPRVAEAMAQLVAKRREAAGVATAAPQ